MQGTKTATRDPGVAAAIEAAEGVGKLAALLGIKSASVSEWSRVPAERVLDIERLTRGAVNRHQMRPDLYPIEQEAAAD